MYCCNVCNVYILYYMYMMIVYDRYILAYHLPIAQGTYIPIIPNPRVRHVGPYRGKTSLG